MEIDCSGCSKSSRRKHLEQNRHPSGRPMQVQKSLFCSLIFITFLGQSLSAQAQTPTTTFRQGSSATSSAQSVASPIPANSPFLGGTPTGKPTADVLQLTLRDAI